MSPAGSRPPLRFSGDTLLLVDVGASMDEGVHRRVMAMTQAVTAAALAGVRDVVPAYTCVGVHVDPRQLDLAALERVIDTAWATVDAASAAARRTVEIPVCYGGEFGPDLEEVSTATGYSAAEVIGRHTAVTYTVFMLGFLPGFAYLGALDPSLTMSRRTSPRDAVPAGSVGIAGRQTGVYPSVSPGGWRLIGRTPWRMFDPAREEPSLLRAGDAVRFVARPASEWDSASREAPR